jgi:DGQHR domain-containing protein
MSTTTEKFQATPCDTITEAYMRAAEAAASVNGNPIPGILYRQGTRRFISTSVSNDFLISLIPPKAAPLKGKKGQSWDADKERNRPLDDSHRDAIRDYLIGVADYILPPILLNTTQMLQVFPVKSPGLVQPCVFVMPRGSHLYVTDGQHRVEGLRAACDVREELRQDAISITIVEEEDLGRCHQDFYDAAQVKKLSPSILVDFDQRAPFNAVTKELVRNVRVFKDRVQHVATQVSKKSPMLFTNSMIKRAVCSLATGNQDNTDAAAQIIGANLPLWKGRLHAFFEAFTNANEVWSLVAERSLETGQPLDIPKHREDYLHFTGAGLLIMSGVGYAIFNRYPTSSAILSPEQETAIHRLGRDIDWHRSNPMWHHSVIGIDDTIQPHRSVLQIAVYDVKREIGLSLDEQDEKDLAKLQEAKRKRSEKKAAQLQAMTVDGTSA